MITKSGFGIFAGICATLLMTGCSAESASEEVGVGYEALTASGPVPAGYPNSALPFDTGTTRAYQSGDWDHPGIFAPRHLILSGTDNVPYFAAECAGSNPFGVLFHDYVIGISARTSSHRPHSAKCVSAARNVNPSSVSTHFLSRWSNVGTPFDDAGDVPGGGWPSGQNWDTSAYSRASCGFHEVVTGVAQTESNEIDAVYCTHGPVASGIGPSTCNRVLFDGVDHCPVGGCGAWAPPANGQTYTKNQCRSDQYVKGVSKKAGTGEISAILCCNW